MDVKDFSALQLLPTQMVTHTPVSAGCYFTVLLLAETRSLEVQALMNTREKEERMKQKNVASRTESDPDLFFQITLCSTKLQI